MPGTSGPRITLLVGRLDSADELEHVVRQWRPRQVTQLSWEVSIADATRDPVDRLAREGLFASSVTPLSPGRRWWTHGIRCLFGTALLGAGLTA